MLDQKSQAALEFLMSYGWAILVVIIAVGALSYFGVLNFDAFLPEKCTLAPGVACLDFKASSDGVALAVKNSLGDTIVVEKIMLLDYNCETTFFATLKNSEQGTFNIDCNLTSVGNKINSEIRFIYEGLDTLQHNSSGKITAKIEKISSGIGGGTSDQQICQQAQNDGMCMGLDIFYGEGYQAACCSEHGLCC